MDRFNRILPTWTLTIDFTKHKLGAHAQYAKWMYRKLGWDLRSGTGQKKLKCLLLVDRASNLSSNVTRGTRGPGRGDGKKGVLAPCPSQFEVVFGKIDYSLEKKTELMLMQCC